MDTVCINKLLKTTDVAGDVKPCFYIETKWLENHVMVKLQDSQTDKCYQGSLTADAMKNSAAELEIPYNEYYEECRLALTTYVALPGCTYKLDENEDGSVLEVWKEENSINKLLLDIPLKNKRNHYDLLDSVIEQLQNQSKSLTDRVEKAHKFDEHSRELLEDYRLCVEEKNQLERKLLRKVAVLLNAKKQKISELEERLSKYEDANDAAADNDDENMDERDADDRPQSSRKRRPLVVESDTEDEDDFIANTEPLTLPEQAV